VVGGGVLGGHDGVGRPAAAQRLVGLDGVQQGVGARVGQGGARQAPGLLGLQGGGQVDQAQAVALAVGLVGAFGPGHAGGQQGDAALVGGQLQHGVLGLAIGGLHRLLVGDGGLLGAGVLGVDVGQQGGDVQHRDRDIGADGPGRAGGRGLSASAARERE
jgi:hypothetical protein